MKEIHQKSEKEKKEVKRKITLFFKKQREVSFAYFFGSFLEKAPLGFRDIDIGIFLHPLTISELESFDYETGLALKISKLICFPADRLDIKILNFSPITLQSNIFSRGSLFLFGIQIYLAPLLKKLREKRSLIMNFQNSPYMS
jgi:predicted nucleotidyltransferase